MAELYYIGAILVLLLACGTYQAKVWELLELLGETESLRALAQRQQKDLDEANASLERQAEHLGEFARQWAKQGQQPERWSRSRQSIPPDLPFVPQGVKWNRTTGYHETPRFLLEDE